MRDLLGGLWSVVAVQAPTAEEQLAILGRAFPQLSALLPAGMAALSLVKAAAGQSWDTTEVSSILLLPHETSVLLFIDRFLQGQRHQTFWWWSVVLQSILGRRDNFCAQKAKNDLTLPGDKGLCQTALPVPSRLAASGPERTCHHV